MPHRRGRPAAHAGRNGVFQPASGFDHLALDFLNDLDNRHAGTNLHDHHPPELIDPTGDDPVTDDDPITEAVLASEALAKELTSAVPHASTIRSASLDRCLALAK